MNKKVKRTLRLAIPIACLLSTGQSALASFHLWDIHEVFSNSDGTLQFVELTTNSAGQGELDGQTLVSSGPEASQQQLVFDRDLVGNTGNQTLLLATQRFANLTGMNPDFIIDNGFVPIDGGTLNFGGGSDVFSFSREQLPRNGVQSLGRDGTAQDASPTRFDGLSTEPPAQASPFAVFDTGNSVLNVPELNVPGIGIANANFTVDVAALEFGVLNFYLYGNSIAAGNEAAFFDGSSLYIPALLFNNEIYEVNLFPVNDDPIILGNPQILSVVAVQPDPDPPQDPLQESIERGQALYSQLCTACHGIDGTGGIGPNLRLSSFNTFEPLRVQIDNNMPRNNPTACRDTTSSSCATDVANYVLNVFQQNTQ